jgi:hypothetical protein
VCSEITFAKNEANEVSTLTSKQEGLEMQAKKVK